MDAKDNHNITLTKDEQSMIDTLAAHFVEDSELLMGLSGALTDAVRCYVARDKKLRAQYTKELA